MEIKKFSKKVLKIKKNSIKCPTCKKYSQEQFAPFCSKKCSDIDLMKWLSDENYIEANSNLKN